jgi:hypothetical protein
MADSVLEKVIEWRIRPLDTLYPILYPVSGIRYPVSGLHYRQNSPGQARHQQGGVMALSVNMHVL